jgi:putative tryptophan/tyrosine transport system substrate-binding protein
MIASLGQDLGRRESIMRRREKPMLNVRRRDIFSFVGGGLLAPRIAWAAQPGGKVPLVGYLWHAGKPEEEQPYYGAVVDEFQKLGYVNGRTIHLEHRFPDENPEHFEAMARELVSLRPDVLMGGAVTTQYLKRATSTIPIVFMNVPDPVGLRLAASLSHPGGNSTGFVNFGRDLVAKRLQLLKEIVPGLTHVALLVNQEQSSAKIYMDEGGAAAAELGLSLGVFDVRQTGALANAFDDMQKGQMQALITASGGSLFQWKTQIASLARDRRLPYCAFAKETFDAGALIGYGADQTQLCRDAVHYVDRILKGADPADLPVQQPTKVQLLINLKVARAINVAIPSSLLATADEVIE